MSLCFSVVLLEYCKCGPWKVLEIDFEFCARTQCDVKVAVSPGPSPGGYNMGAPGLFKGAPYNLSSCSPIHFLFFSLLFLSCPVHGLTNANEIHKTVITAELFIHSFDAQFLLQYLQLNYCALYTLHTQDWWKNDFMNRGHNNHLGGTVPQCPPLDDGPVRVFESNTDSAFVSINQYTVRWMV